MSKYFIFFLMFSFFALSAVGFSVYDSSFFKTDNSSAEGFGISPPYYQNNNLKAGDSYSKTIGIMRSIAKTPAKAEVNINADEIENWLTIKPGLLVNLEAGDYNTPLNITANVPADAKPGVYSGFIYLEFITDENNIGVGIRTGARIDIKLIVIGEPAVPTKDFKINNDLLYGQLKGKVISQATNTDEIYYISPDKKQAFYISSSTDLMTIIKEQGLGISGKNLEKIPVNLSVLTGLDSDLDGLPDNLEKSLGTNENSDDSDLDGFNDLYEISNGYSPIQKSQAMPIDLKFAQSVSGRIFLQVENKGQAWYINPNNLQRYFLPTPTDALSMMKNLSISVSAIDFEKLKNSN